MHLLKAPIIDRIPALFYKKFWSIVGDQTTEACLQILNNGVSLDEVNNTIIHLIPKLSNPSSPSDYRPLSLCNVLYKINVKVLANRLKVILPVIILEEQSTFVLNRKISNNTMIASEVFHALHQGVGSSANFLALKLDMSKAYDRG